MLTAWEAARVVPHVETSVDPNGAVRHVDLGCGIGSVLLMIAYKHPHVRSVGIEAQEVSFELAKRNVSRNRLTWVELHHGDLRDPEWVERLGRFDLVTGTPPYMPPGTSTPSPDLQRRFARIEMRGGIEAYLDAAGRLLTDAGRVVVCADARHPERVARGAANAGLQILRRRDAVPREGRDALFSVWTLERSSGAAVRTVEHAAPFIARTASGARTRAYLDLRAYFDLPGSRVTT